MATIPQSTIRKLVPYKPNSKCVPHIWHYEEMRSGLFEAGDVLNSGKAERRVLPFVNPQREIPYTVDTFQTGIQLMLPNEIAQAHRHMVFAMRFVIEGEGGWTAVQGQRIPMSRGDLIVTPRWNWHDHGHSGSGPMIWMDTLDLPNFINFPVHFHQMYGEKVHPSVTVNPEDCPVVYTWAQMQRKLDKTGEVWTSEEYVKQDGRPVSQVLGASAERLEGGGSSPLFQETVSSVYFVIAGRGFSEINGETISWKVNDTFCVPAWNKFFHTAEGSETAYLYRMHDKPMLKALGLYRTSDDDIETLASD